MLKALLFLMALPASAAVTEISDGTYLIFKEFASRYHYRVMHLTPQGIREDFRFDWQAKVEQFALQTTSYGSPVLYGMDSHHGLILRIDHTGMQVQPPAYIASYLGEERGEVGVLVRQTVGNRITGPEYGTFLDSTRTVKLENTVSILYNTQAHGSDPPIRIQNRINGPIGIMSAYYFETSVNHQMEIALSPFQALGPMDRFVDFIDVGEGVWILGRDTFHYQLAFYSRKKQACEATYDLGMPSTTKDLRLLQWDPTDERLYFQYGTSLQSVARTQPSRVEMRGAFSGMKYGFPNAEILAFRTEREAPYTVVNTTPSSASSAPAASTPAPPPAPVVAPPAVKDPETESEFSDLIQEEWDRVQRAAGGRNPMPKTLNAADLVFFVNQTGTLKFYVVDALKANSDPALNVAGYNLSAVSGRFASYSKDWLAKVLADAACAAKLKRLAAANAPSGKAKP